MTNMFNLNENDLADAQYYIRKLNIIVEKYNIETIAELVIELDEG